MESPRIRAAVVRVIDCGDAETRVIGPSIARTFTGDSAALVRAVLEIHGRPVTREELIRELAELGGGEVPVRPVDELVAMLVADGVLVAPRAAPVASYHLPRRVVLGISGAIAAVDSPQLVRGLQALGCDVRIALTTSARRFVGVAALEALTHHRVWRGLWQRDAETPVPHINLAAWAELVLVAPASATTLARIAAGDCSDLVSAIACATTAPVVVVPSMNDAMYASPAVQDNLATLRAHGRWLVHPALGFEVAHRPEDRRPMFGPAPPPGALVDIVRHLLAEVAPRPRLPIDAAGWERLWATTPVERMPWHVADADPALDAVIARHSGTLIDLGTGAGTIAIAAARRGFAVTATELAPSALGRARDRAGALPILFALDDVTRSSLTGTFDVAVDSGVLHCLPVTERAAYAATVTRLVRSGGALVIVAHAPGADLATHPLTGDDLAALLPAFTLASAAPTTLSGAAAHVFELRRG